MNPIHRIGRSPKTAEPPTVHPPLERDADRLYRELVSAFGPGQAQKLGQSLAGLSYDVICARFVEALVDADTRTVFSQKETE